LHALRVLAGLVFLAWLLGFAGHQHALFGLGGWFDSQAYREAARLPGGTPAPVGWSILYLCGTSKAMLTAVYWGSLAVLMLFTLGVWTRLTAVLTYVVVASFSANPALAYDGDYLLILVAFYLMVGYVLLGQWGRPLSLAARLLGPADTILFRHRQGRPASHAATLAVRLLQLHFAIVVLSSGLHKLQFGDWWSGLGLWYPLHPPLETTRASLKAHAGDLPRYFFVLSLAQYVMLAWQLGFPVFAWRPRWRVVLVGGAVVGWLGSLLVYGLPLFGPVLLLASLSYLTPAEWQSLLGFPLRTQMRVRGFMARLNDPVPVKEVSPCE
jgi:hypothetical protein